MEDWLEKMSNLLDKLYSQETRQVFRLGVLKEAVTCNMVLWEEQMLEECPGLEAVSVMLASMKKFYLDQMAVDTLMF